MDHPENVTEAHTWKPPVHKVRVPRAGVTLEGGVFQKSVEDNIEYLLNSYSVDDLLRQFRERTARSNLLSIFPVTRSSGRGPCRFQRRRFLMAAGNTLRWSIIPNFGGALTPSWMASRSAANPTVM